MKGLVLAIFLLSACTPSINYLGDSYGYSSSVEIFYDEGDIPRDFKIMGHLSHDLFINHAPESIQEEMIKVAMEKGADAILFSDYTTTANADCDSRNVVKASLVKFL